MEWYLIQCKSGQDGRAVEHLVNQGFECYKPEITVEKVKKGKLFKVKNALFPGYIFIRLDKIISKWSVIRSTRGVLKLVAFGAEPTPVDESVICELKKCCGNGYVSMPLFKKGVSVNIISGPFAQLEAIYQEQDGEKRAVILLNIMSKWQKIALPLKQLAS